MRLTLFLSIRFISLMVVLGVSACTPSYTVDQTELYAREIGITKRYQISRWHNRVFSSGNKLFVVVAPRADDSSTNDLSAIIHKGFLPFFSRVGFSDQPKSLAAGLSAAKKRGDQFLIFSQLLEGDVSQDEEQSIDDSQQMTKDPESNLDKSSSTHHIVLLLSVVDVNSGSVVDKVKLSAKPELFNFLGSDTESLLHKPLMRIGQDLTGG